MDVVLSFSIDRALFKELVILVGDIPKLINKLMTLISTTGLYCTYSECK